jgi:hypothetical protein
MAAPAEIPIGIVTALLGAPFFFWLLRREVGDTVEFVTLMWFESMESVRAFAGDDPEVAVVLPGAEALLARFDARSEHYEVKVDGTHF